MNVITSNVWLWSYAYLYDSEWNLLYSGYGEPAEAEDTYRVARFELTAGETYYIGLVNYGFGASSVYSPGFSVYLSKASRAVSAELVLTDSRTLELYQGLESYEAEGVDEDGNTVTYDCYDFTDLEFVSGDQIVITFEDGSTLTYTSSVAGVFYDEDDNRLYYTYSSTQSGSDSWEPGNTYSFTMTLYDYEDVTVDVPVTIVENPYTDATLQFVTSDGSDTIAVYEGTDSYTYYDDDDNAYEY